MKKIFYIFFILNTLTFSKYLEVKHSKVKTVNGRVVLKKNNLPLTGMVKYDRDREYYVNGLASGKWVTHHQNGKMKSIETWENGKLNGKYVLYNNSGVKTFETNYTNGKENGEFKIYHEGNGQLQIHGYFNHGTPIGTWNYYNSSGMIYDTKVHESIL